MGVSRQDGVVWLDDGGGDLGRGVDGEAELGLLAVINGKSLEEERSKTGSSATTDGVVTTGEVVGGILLTRDKLFGMEELSVGAGSDLIDDGRLEIEEDGARNVLASTSLGEEGVESIVATTDGLVGWHLTVWLNTVLEAEELPAGVTNLDTGLTD